MGYVFNDGGKVAAGFKGSEDCATRALAIALELDYKDARAILMKHSKMGRLGSGAISRGVYKEDLDSALRSLGWKWVSVKKIAGRKAKYTDIDSTRFIARMAKHFVAVVNGNILDTFDSSDKMVYGYWEKTESIT
jgi:hypothetical protein